MRASIAAEAAGIPSVSILCRGFEGQGRATGRGLGFDDMPLAVTTDHVDAQDHEAMVADFVTHTVRQVIDGLTAGAGTGRSADGIDTGSGGTDDEPTALEVVAAGSLDEINRIFLRRGWSDGLPVIPPTRQRVEAFLARWGRDPWRSVGVARSSGRDLTIWSIAVNAVMAGCSSEHFPVLLAAAEILADPGYGAEHSGNTTGADALMVLSGPGAAADGFNSGPGALRDGTHANTSVGRWLRLYQRNVLGFTTEEHDKATFGNTFRVVLCEDHDTLTDLGWEPLAADFGFGPDDDALSMARMNSGAIVGSVFGSSPEAILPYLGDGLARILGWDLTHVYGLGQAQQRPLLVLSPILARTFARAGWSKQQVRDGLFEHARIPAWRFEKLIGEWSNLTAGRRSLVDLASDGLIPSVFARSNDPDRLVPVVTRPTEIMIAVAGDPNRTNAYVFSHDGPHGDWVARAVDREPADELACIVPPHSGDTM